MQWSLLWSPTYNDNNNNTPDIWIPWEGLKMDKNASLTIWLSVQLTTMSYCTTDISLAGIDMQSCGTEFSHTDTHTKSKITYLRLSIN